MPKKAQPNGHVFGRQRPSHDDKFTISTKPKRDTHFRPLPPPTGKLPLQLNLKSIIPAKDYAAIVARKKLTFHLNGDMGGKGGASQQQTLVASGMEADFDPKANASENPAFLYINGDCVYFNGEVNEYYSQFYQPYEFYPGPVFAVPGNHDGENLPGDNTLNGFVRNFCAPQPVKMPESGDSHRTAMTQPNVYWTLLTPLASIIGLYSNVPEGGSIRTPQTEWLVDQLKTLPKSLPVIIALHHPVYSADTFHSGSSFMKETLEKAAVAANRHPEMVVAGHVHAYERITRKMPNGDQIPYLVTGAGGYPNLHSMMKVNGKKLVAPVVFDDKTKEPVTLEKYSDDHHGFMRIEITNKLITGHYFTVPRPHEPFGKGNQLFDYFEFDWKKRRYVPNSL